MPAAPPPDPAAALLDRLRARDATATYDVFNTYMEPLVGFLRRSGLTRDEHHLYEAAGEVIRKLIERPEAFKPGLGTLGGYLRMAARRDLMNLVSKENRHHRDRADGEFVELAPDGRNDDGGDEWDGPTFDDPRLAAVIAAFTPAERAFFDLLRAGENRSAVLAVPLGLGDRPAAEQQTEVKRTRDRLFKRLQRAEEET